MFFKNETPLVFSILGSGSRAGSSPAIRFDLSSVAERWRVERTDDAATGRVEFVVTIE